jgi:hypothetical protein
MTLGAGWKRSEKAGREIVPAAGGKAEPAAGTGMKKRGD